MSDFRRCKAKDCQTAVHWHTDDDLWLCPTHLRAEVERLRALIAEGDFKELYAEGLTVGQKLGASTADAEVKRLRAEIEWRNIRDGLVTTLLDTYRILCEPDESAQEKIVEATGTLFDFDVTHPKP